MKKKVIVAVILISVSILIIFGLIFIQPKQKNLEFRSSECNGSGGINYLLGVRNVEWINDSTIQIKSRVSINCASSIKGGSYSLEGDKIILDYKIRNGRLFAKCDCNHDLIYKIAGIEKKDYEIVLKGYEDFKISCEGLYDARSLQECCQALAEDNDLMVIQCVGEWEIKENQCAWKCGTNEDKYTGTYLYCPANETENVEDTQNCCNNLMTKSYNITDGDLPLPIPTCHPIWDIKLLNDDSSKCLFRCDEGKEIENCENSHNSTACCERWVEVNNITLLDRCELFLYMVAVNNSCWIRCAGIE